MKRKVNINLGSGPDGMEGWINFDWGWLPLLSKFPLILTILVRLGIVAKSYLRKWPKIWLYDLRKGIPLQSGGVDWIYHSNFMEHLEKYEAEKFLKECWRVLRIGGKMRLVVPDLDKLVGRYKKWENADIFCREFYGYDKDKNIGIKSAVIRGHQWMYNQKSMVDLLRKVGFTKIGLSQFAKSKMPDVAKLDLPIHRDLGLYLEVEKG
ncbi:MAG: methyltransferase domain-containing protein [Microgenomates group bacterium]